MNLDELSKTLPNGFHDSRVASLRIDYRLREVTMDVAVWVGDLSSSDPDTREAYRQGLLTISGLVFCSIEPPDSRYPYQDRGAITIDTGTLETLARPPAAKLPDDKKGTFTNWLYVSEWNAFIYLSATQASLTWQTDVE